MYSEPMKLIPLTKGMFAQVSDHRYDDLMQWKWQAVLDTRGNKNWYAARTTRKKEVGYAKRVYMHRQILGLDLKDKREGDHIKTEDTLNNTDENLRIADRRKQNCNRGRRKDNTSGYRWISKDPKKEGWWYGQMCHNNLVWRCWRGTDPAVGHEVCKEIARLYHGEFMRSD